MDYNGIKGEFIMIDECRVYWMEVERLEEKDELKKVGNEYG